jgi:actin-related protein 8
MNYNRQSDYEEISAHNDAFPVEWTEVSAGKRFYVGRDALHLNPSEKFTLFWPFKSGTFNNCDYSRLEEVVDDLGILWRGVIEAELSVKSTEFCNYSLVLVLPDSFERAELKACVSAALGKEAPFRAVSVIQESQAVAFGCGVSSGVVVDLGAQKISVACVEEGFVALETRVVLPIGGDNITRLFGELLRIHEFPYEFDLTNPLDWALLDDLKERCCTVNEAEIAPSAAIFEVYVRKPSELTRKFLFKMFEERIMAPMELFEPEMGLLHAQCEAQNHPGLLVNAFDLEDSFVEPITDDGGGGGGGVVVVTDTANARSISCCWDSCGASFEVLSAALEHFESVHFAAYTGDSCKCGNCSYSCVDRLSLQCHVIGTHFMPSSIDVKNAIGDLKTRLADRFHSVPLSVDEAVIESLVRLGDSDRIKRCASSVILSGGSHLFSGFPDVLYSALSAKLPQNPLTALLEAKIFPNARDLDARFLAWKGGAVFCRLESTSEAWITCGEWDLFGVRSIKEKVSFIN